MKIQSRLMVLLIAAPAIAHADLVINLDFTGFENNAPADIGTIFNGASLDEAKAVIQAAADYWETAFAGSNSTASFAVNGRITQNIAVGWEALGGSTLGQGGTGWYSNGRFSGGQFNMDSDGSSRFYVDKTPYSNSEYRKTSTRSALKNGVNVNLERAYYDSALAAVDDYSDLLSVVMHEMGHTLGYLGPYPGYAASVDADGKFVISSGPYAGAKFDTNDGHLADLLPAPEGMFISTYYPELMGPSVVQGMRKTASVADIAALAQTLGFDMNTVNFNPTPVPEPSAYALGAGALATGIVAVRRRKRRA